MLSALFGEFLFFKPPGIWKRSMVQFFPYVTDTADYTFKLSLIMPTDFINQNMQAQVVFCEKAYHFITLKQA